MSSYQQNDAVLAETFEDSMVLYHTDTERYFSLNALGAEIWRTLSQPSSPEALVERIVSEYEVELEVAEKDVEDLLIDLEKADLVMRTDP